MQAARYMTMDAITQLTENRFLSTKGLSDWDEQRLQAAVRRGDAVRLRNGLYSTRESLADVMVDIDVIIPDGILCLWSAWAVYGLTTSIPNAYYVAIERSRKVTLPREPAFQLVFQTKKLLSLGVTQKEVQGYNIRIYDIERCVCDAVKYRNKIGIDVMAEIVKEYLRRPERNISRLMDYASQLRVRNILERYLEIWL